MDAIVRCGRCLAGGRGCLLKGPHLIPSLKIWLPYLINVHRSIGPFLLKSRDMQYCPSGKTRLINVCGSLNCSFIMAYAMLTTFIFIRCPDNLADTGDTFIVRIFILNYPQFLCSHKKCQVQISHPIHFHHSHHHLRYCLLKDKFVYFFG